VSSNGHGHTAPEREMREIGEMREMREIGEMREN
jgi:hypothetical protein